eukprot:CAMPEP_0206025662 /NCGR_PEP_ID=MMETSP1464-20131121/40451_1 /ASSEMBLY_ACC=CAM_ASM_001124 /TAXON_ID=119497 /ORGANISM="Exanthemachrysis gayraliae, Strain RCC1523" /LENGTH=65 /DNA_ID=CAMNT_0053399697 /DNA_START=15 /DNA_END=208 /DNA_ORIENTATION=-
MEAGLCDCAKPAEKRPDAGGVDLAATAGEIADLERRLKDLDDLRLSAERTYQALLTTFATALSDA